MRRWLPRLAALLAIAALAFWVFAPRPLRVEAVEATRGGLVHTVDEDGKTRVRDRYVVSTPVAGRIARMTLQVGDAVERNAVIALVSPAPPGLIDARARAELRERVGAAEANVDRARATLARSRASASQAAADLGRSENLRQRGFVSAAQVERDRLALEVARREEAVAESQLDAAGHDLAQARAALATTASGVRASGEAFEVRSPVAGRVLRLLQQSEAVLALGTPLIEIGDPVRIEIAADVLSTDAVAVVPGAQVTIERWGGDGEVLGRVRTVEPRAFTKVSALGIEEQRVTVVVDVVRSPEAWARVGDGYRVLTRIATASVDDAVLVPAGALIRAADGWQVFVAQEGRARLRTVKVSLRDATRAAIAAGIEAGEKVIRYPPASLRDGARIAAS